MAMVRSTRTVSEARPEQATAAAILLWIDASLQLLQPHLESSVQQERPNDHHRDDTTTKFRYRCALELKIHFGI
jgi:hypothetical protein